MSANGAFETLAQNAQTVRVLSEQARALEQGQFYELSQELLHGKSTLPTSEQIRKCYAEVWGENAPSAQYASFCSAFVSSLSDCEPLFYALLRECGTTTGAAPLKRVAYLSTAYADHAFSTFSARENGLRPVLQESFSAAAEEVYYGRCGYCILPYRSSDEGHFGFFQRLLTKYNLKIALACAEKQGDLTTHFALLRRNIAPVRQSASDLRITLSVVCRPHEDIRLLLCAAEAVGAVTEDFTVSPLAYTDESVSVCVTFCVNKSSITALLLFLQTSESRFSVDGIYELL